MSRPAGAVCAYCGAPAVLRLRRAHRWAVLDLLLPYPWRVVCAAHAPHAVTDAAAGGTP